jgi:rhodanese-related sulfurtransferase
LKKLISIILLISFVITNSFSQETKSLVVDELEVYLPKGIIVIDIRNKNEWQRTGIIPKSYRLTYIEPKTKNDDRKWMHILIRLIKDKNRAFVLVSKEGKQAKRLVERLYRTKKIKNGIYLEGGIQSWIDANRQVVKY